MGFISQLGAPPGSLQEKTTERFTTVGLAGGLAFALAGAAAAGHMPFAAAWTAETAITLGGFAGVTLHKANRWGWALTGFAAVVCLAEALGYVTGLSTSHAGGGLSWAAGGLIAVGWVCMLHLPRHREREPEPVTHVVNHHVFHGLPGGVQLPGTAVTGEVIQVPQPAVTGSRGALEAGQPMTDKEFKGVYDRWRKAYRGVGRETRRLNRMLDKVPAKVGRR